MCIKKKKIKSVLQVAPCYYHCGLSCDYQIILQLKNRVFQVKMNQAGYGKTKFIHDKAVDICFKINYFCVF